LLPNAAVQRGAPGTFVYVVKPDETVAAQAVTLGPGNEQRVVVTKGLEPGQIVVVDGADRLKDGAKVRVTRNAAAAASQPSGGRGRRRRPPRRQRRSRAPRSISSARTASADGETSETAQRKIRVSPSRIFILRPVATSLLMVAIMLVGIVAYRFLPLSALPEV